MFEILCCALWNNKQTTTTITTKKGRQVPGWDLSYYIRGYQRKWVPAEQNRPKLAFTVILATDKVLVVRGSKTGGIAIFRKIDQDMTSPAYGNH